MRGFSEWPTKNFTIVRGWYLKQGRGFGIKSGIGRSVTFAQRFGSALNLNPHFHSLLLDGVFNTKTDVFHSAPLLRDEDVKQIVEITAYRDEQPLLAGMTSASVMGLVSTGERAKNRDKVVPKKPDEEELQKTRGKSKYRFL